MTTTPEEHWQIPMLSHFDQKLRVHCSELQQDQTPHYSLCCPSQLLTSSVVEELALFQLLELPLFSNEQKKISEGCIQAPENPVGALGKRRISWGFGVKQRERSRVVTKESTDYTCADLKLHSVFLWKSALVFPLLGHLSVYKDQEKWLGSQTYRSEDTLAAGQAAETW